MPLRSMKGVAVRTARDEARRQEREDLALEWARVDALLADALPSDGTIHPRHPSDREVS